MKKLKKINLNKSFEDFTPLKEWELRTKYGSEKLTEKKASIL